MFKPGGAGFQTKDGALGMKFGWTRGIPGKFNVTGRRIDGDAPPLRFHTNQTNDAHSSGFIASYLIFPAPGCWEVTAQIGDRVESKITFVTRVEKAGDGPAWRVRDEKSRIKFRPRERALDLAFADRKPYKWVPYASSRAKESRMPVG